MKKSTKKNVAIGAGIASLAAIAAGTYFFTATKKGKKAGKKIAGWASKAKKEVAGEIKKLKDVNKRNYEKVVSGVISRYKTVKNIDPKELALLSQELKSHWEGIKKEIDTRISKAVQKPATKKKVKR